MIDVQQTKNYATQLLKDLKIKNSPELTLVKTLFQMSQDFVDPEAASRVLDLLDELL